MALLSSELMLIVLAMAAMYLVYWIVTHQHPPTPRPYGPKGPCVNGYWHDLHEKKEEDALSKIKGHQFTTCRNTYYTDGDDKLSLPKNDDTESFGCCTCYEDYHYVGTGELCDQTVSNEDCQKYIDNDSIAIKFTDIPPGGGYFPDGAFPKGVHKLCGCPKGSGVDPDNGWGLDRQTCKTPAYACTETGEAPPDDPSIPINDWKQYAKCKCAKGKWNYHDGKCEGCDGWCVNPQYSGTLIPKYDKDYLTIPLLEPTAVDCSCGSGFSILNDGMYDDTILQHNVGDENYLGCDYDDSAPTWCMEGAAYDSSTGKFSCKCAGCSAHHNGFTAHKNGDSDLICCDDVANCPAARAPTSGPAGCPWTDEVFNSKSDIEKQAYCTKHCMKKHPVANYCHNNECCPQCGHMDGAAQCCNISSHIAGCLPNSASPSSYKKLTPV